MNQPVIIVDPVSSAVELAPSLRKLGIPAIALTVGPHMDYKGFGATVRTSDFSQVLTAATTGSAAIRRLQPLAVIPGAEGGVELAQHLAQEITPQFANPSVEPLNRLHKAHMQQLLQRGGVPQLASFSSGQEDQVTAWIEQHGGSEKPWVVKPPQSAGSSSVFHIPPGGDWRTPFKKILAESSNVTGAVNHEAVLQEQAIGTEYAVGTVSADGYHHLAHLIRYNKVQLNGRATVYDHVEFIGTEDPAFQQILTYTRKALDALSIKWGPAHSEIMLTKAGPRLIESAPRMCGGPVVSFARQATGSSQADLWAEILKHRKVQAPGYTYHQKVVAVFIRSPQAGRLENSQVLREAEALPTFFQKHFWFSDGDRVPQTKDYLTNLGIIALSGNPGHIRRDYWKIRNLETKLQFIAEA